MPSLFFDEICGSLNCERWTPYHLWLKYFQSDQRTSPNVRHSFEKELIAYILEMSIFVTLSPTAGAMTISGKASADALKAGMLIEMHGYFSKGERTGGALGLVLRRGAKSKEYLVKPLGAEDQYWSHHLMAHTEITIRLQVKAGEVTSVYTKPGGVVELIEKWSVVAEPDAEVNVDRYRWLAKGGVQKLVKDVEFLRKYVCSDLPEKPQESHKATSPLLEI